MMGPSPTKPRPPQEPLLIYPTFWLTARDATSFVALPSVFSLKPCGQPFRHRNPYPSATLQLPLKFLDLFSKPPEAVYSASEELQSKRTKSRQTFIRCCDVNVLFRKRKNDFIYTVTANESDSGTGISMKLDANFSGKCQTITEPSWDLLCEMHHTFSFLSETRSYKLLFTYQLLFKHLKINHDIARTILGSYFWITASQILGYTVAFPLLQLTYDNQKTTFNQIYSMWKEDPPEPTMKPLNPGTSIHNGKVIALGYPIIIQEQNTFKVLTK